MKRTLSLAVLILAAAAVTFLPAGASQTADLSGKWRLTVEAPGAPESIDCMIEQKADGIVVKWSGEGMEFKGEGTIKDGTVEWKMIDDRNKAEIPFTGTITSSREAKPVEMSGQFTLPGNAGVHNWKAVRVEG